MLTDNSNFDPDLMEGMELPRSNAILLKLIVFLSVASICWLCISEVDIVSTATGRVSPEGRVKSVQAAETSIISAIHVSDGRHVKKDEVLFEFDSSLTEPEQQLVKTKLILANAELKRLESELSDDSPSYENPKEHEAIIEMQEQLREARKLSYKARLAQAEVSLQESQASLHSAESLAASLQEIAKHAQDQEEKLRPHIGTVVSQFSYDSTRESMLTKQNELAIQISKISSLKNGIKIDEKKLDSLKNEYRSQLVAELYEKRREVASLESESQKIDRIINMKELRAPVAGTIQSVDVTTLGGVVSPTQVLARIVPDDMPLVIEVNLANSDIGFVKIGQPAEIKVDAYPFMQYGALTGMVTQISPDSDEVSVNNNISASTLASSHSFYRIRIAADKYKSGMNSRIIIKPGMTVQADIKTGKRTLIQFFVQPLIRYWDETVSLR